MYLQQIKEGLRIFKARLKAYPRYKGNAEQICNQIVDKCFNGKFFQTGADSYPQFWTRDFGFCTNSLLFLGYKKEVHNTLTYALTQFKKQNRITCYIDENNIPQDFPTYAVDSLPLLLHAIRLSKFNIDNYKDFLNQEIQMFYNKVVDKNGLVKQHTHFSSMKDHFKRNSSCYDNCMLYLLQQETKKLKLNTPLETYNYQELIKKHFWNKEYFQDDLTSKEISGDANTFPFWTNLYNDKDLFNACKRSIQKQQLDQPWPLKYTKKNHFGQIPASIFVPTWEGDKLWSFLGLYFIETALKFNTKLSEKYLEEYTQHIEKNKNFFELFNKNKTPYKSFFYKSDHSMLWASKYLHLKTLIQN